MCVNSAVIRHVHNNNNNNNNNNNKINKLIILTIIILPVSDLLLGSGDSDQKRKEMRDRFYQNRLGVLCAAVELILPLVRHYG